jgi:glutamyl endopeptidase
MQIPTGIHAPVTSEMNPRRSREASPVRQITTQVERVRGYRRPAPAMPPETRREIILAARAVGNADAPALNVAQASFGSPAQQEIIIGGDDRQPIADPTDTPWRRICALRITSKSGLTYVGTGWFIGPNALATAGHCVYLHDDGGWPASIRVVPALNGTLESFGHDVGTTFRSTSGWVNDRDTGADYGVIQLDGSALGDRVGWFSFGAYLDPDLETSDANIAGYPYDRDLATRQYFHARRITALSPTRLFYDIDTYGGQSGSPIWLNLGDERIAVGVHTTGSKTSNSGTRITADVFANLKNWKEDAFAAIHEPATMADIVRGTADTVAASSKKRGRIYEQEAPKPPILNA